MIARDACIVIGGGGHSRVIIDTLQALSVPVHGILDADPAVWGSVVQDVGVLGGDDLLPSLRREGLERFAIGLGGVGDNGPRQRLFETACAHGLRPFTLVHPSATVSPRARIGDGCQVLPAAVVNAGARLGVNVLINTGGIVEHDCAIDDHVHVATGARLSGGVRVGRGAHVGAGATVRQGVAIGAGALIAAGAVVVKDVAPGECVAGVPARALTGSAR